MAVAKAEKIINSNLRAEEVVLDSLGLDNLAPLLPALSQLTRLRKLRLARNNMTSLPEDLTALRSLEYLDISGNPITGLNAAIRGLFCLTNLKHLFIDLPFEGDEEEIIVSLHSLESFNGTPLTDNFDDDLLKQGQPQQQAGGAPSAVQPQPAASQPMSQQQRAAVAQPPASAAAPRTTQSPPRSVSAIGAKTKWDDADMSQVQRLYQAANSVSGRVVNRSEFDEYTRNVVSHLHTLLTGEEDPFKREAEIIKAKKIMFEYCFEEIARSSHRFDANLSQVLSVLQDTYSGLLENYERLFRNLVEDRERKLEVMKNDMQHAIQEIEQLMGQMDGGKGDGNSKAQFDVERRKLTEEIGWLRAENEKMQARVRQLEAGRPNATPGRLSASASGPSPTQQQAPPPLGAKVLTQTPTPRRH